MLPFCSHPFHAVQRSSPGAPAVCMRPARSRMRLVLLGDALNRVSLKTHLKFLTVSLLRSCSSAGHARCSRAACRRARGCWPWATCCTI